VQDEAAGAGEQAVEPVDREQQRAGKNVLLDEVHAAAQFLVARVGAGDELQREQAAGFQQPGNHVGERRLVAVAQRLDHLDRDNLVELTPDVAEIAELHLDAIIQTGRSDPLAREFVLLLRNRHGRDAATVGTGGVERPAAPTRADLEHVVRWLQAQLAAEGLVLLALGGLQRELRRAGRPAGRRVHHRRIQPEREEVVREVVVLADVAAGDGARVGAQQVADAVYKPQEVERRRHGAAGAGERRRVFDVQHEERDQRGEVRRLPVAVDVRLGKPNVARPKALPEKCLAVNLEVRARGQAEGKPTVRGVVGRAELERAAVGQLEPQVAALHGGERLDEGAAIPRGAAGAAGRDDGGSGDKRGAVFLRGGTGRNHDASEG
jgi:hypothetical protein